MNHIQVNNKELGKNKDKVLRRMQQDIMLIRVQIRKPSSVKKSDRIAKEAAMLKGIDLQSVGARLTKMQGENMDKHAKILGEARAYLAFRTSAYGEDGWRMIQAKYCPDVIAKLKEYKMQAEELVEVIVNEDYESIREDAKSRLGEEFDHVDFPSREQLASSYGFDIKRTTFTTGTTHVLKASIEVLNDIEHELNENAMEQVKSSRDEVKGRYVDSFKTVVETLENYDTGREMLGPIESEITRLKALPAKPCSDISSAVWRRYKSKAKSKVKSLQEEKKKYRVRNNGSAMNNAKALMAVFEQIDITGDPDMGKVVKVARDLCEDLDGENTKADKSKRRKAISTSKDVLAQLQAA